MVRRHTGGCRQAAAGTTSLHSRDIRENIPKKKDSYGKTFV